MRTIAPPRFREASSPARSQFFKIGNNILQIAMGLSYADHCVRLTHIPIAA